MLRGSFKEPSTPKSSGLAHLMSALHQNAAAVVNSKTQLNGPDQILPSDGCSTCLRNGTVKLRKEDQGLGSEEPISVPTLLRETAEAYPEVDALRVKREGTLRTWTYEQYYAEVQLAGRGFIHLGLHRHHSVIILGHNSPEWVIADLGAIFAGAIAVGQSILLSADEIAREALDAKADIIVVENEELLMKVLEIQHKLPELRAIVQMKGEPPVAEKRKLNRTHKKHIVSWIQLLEIGRELPEGHFHDRLIRIGINQCCTLVYTSESASPTKGVMLSHDNLTWCSKMVLGLVRPPGFNRLPAPGEEIILSYIPFSHAASQTIDIYYSITIAGTLCFVEDDRDLMDNSEALLDAIAEVQPTVFFGLPRAYEMLYHRFREMKRRMSGAHRLLVDWSNRALRDVWVRPSAFPEPQTNRSTTPKRLDQLRNAVAKKVVGQKYKEILGFTPRTVFLCRGSPLAREVFKYLAGFDIVVHEMLGQSENCGLLTANIPKRYIKLGTCGKSVPGVKTKITPLPDSTIKTPRIDGTASSDQVGEVCCWGRNVFMGYLNKENDTKEVFTDDHWLTLSDLGYLDEDKFLSVIGRMEDFVTLKSQEVISPIRIEQLVRLELPCVKQVIVVGENQDYLSVLLTLHTEPDEETKMPGMVLTDDVQRWFRQSRYDVRTLNEVMTALENGLKHVIQAGIDRANQMSLCTEHMILSWRIMPKTFMYQNGEISVTGQMKRSAIMEKYSSCIASIYTPTIVVDCDQDELDGHKVDMQLPSYLSLIKEEDESKTSSRNSIDEVNLEKIPKLTFNEISKQDKVQTDSIDLAQSCEGLVIQVKADSFHGSTIAIHNLEDAARAGTVATHRQVIQIHPEVGNGSENADNYDMDSLEVSHLQSKGVSHRKLSNILSSPDTFHYESSPKITRNKKIT